MTGALEAQSARIRTYAWTCCDHHLMVQKTALLIHVSDPMTCGEQTTRKPRTVKLFTLTSMHTQKYRSPNVSHMRFCRPTFTSKALCIQDNSCTAQQMHSVPNSMTRITGTVLILDMSIKLSQCVISKSAAGHDHVISFEGPGLDCLIPLSP